VSWKNQTPEVRTLEEVDSAPQQARQSIEQIDSADLVVGILADLGEDVVASVCGALRTIPGNPRIVVLLSHPASTSTLTSSESPSEDGSLSLVEWSLQDPNIPATGAESVLAAYQSIFAVGGRLGVRGCCVIASQLEHATSNWVCWLTEPLLEPGYDFVAPCYARRKFEGLLNNSIVSPLTRSLYGKRIQNPMGPDLGVSQRLFHRLMGGDQDGKPAGGMRLLASLVPQALCDNLQVCQAYLGARIYPSLDWSNVSSLLADILGPVFLSMEKNAACWQRTRTSSPVMALNEPLPAPPTPGTVDIGRMVNLFQLGNRDLQEIWGLVLPPATLLELKKLSRLAPEEFQFPDELWVRIVYDFALAHRLRTMNRDHLLRSLTPLYLGWVASYARELEMAEATEVELRIERLSLSYEAEKPYLVSRWRWPDRFNP
jgi:glucosylglycerate synthase